MGHRADDEPAGGGEEGAALELAQQLAAVAEQHHEDQDDWQEQPVHDLGENITWISGSPGISTSIAAAPRKKASSP